MSTVADHGENPDNVQVISGYTVFTHTTLTKSSTAKIWIGVALLERNSVGGTQDSQEYLLKSVLGTCTWMLIRRALSLANLV